MSVKTEVSSKDYLSALSLNERYKLKENKHTIYNESNLSKWRERRSVISNDSFETMLKKNNYDKGVFSNCLEEDMTDDIEMYDAHLLNSDWFIAYKEAIELTDRYNVDYENHMGFGYIIRPFSLYVQSKLAESFGRYETTFKLSVINDIINSFITDTVRISSKSLVLELNVSRLRNELVGETSEERFHSFNKLFNSRERLLEFYTEYTVLARVIATKAIFTVNNTLEFFERILTNKADIYQEFNISPTETIIGVSSGIGDSHNKGRSVMSIKLCSGRQLVYKPKVNQVGIAYHKFIHWLNKFDEVLDMPTYRIMDLGPFSIEEFIKKKSCEDPKQIEEFYVRFGQILATMYLLNGTDMHMENIIAHGSAPIIIDFETLLHNPIPYDWPDSAHMEAIKKGANLVSNTMLLPIEIKDNFLHEEGLDLSGLSGREQKMPYKIPSLINENSDEMVFAMTEGFEIEGADNIPELNGHQVNYTKYIENIVLGFKTVCNTFLNNKSELLKSNGILRKFKDLKVRIIPRGTPQYFNMINNTYHPDYLRNSLGRERVLENIWSVPYKDKSIIKSEYKDMMDDDVPIFFNVVNNKDLIDSQGRVFRDTFEEDAYSMMLSKVRSLNSSEIDKQISVIYVKSGKYETLLHGGISDANYNSKPKYTTPSRTFKEIIDDNQLTSRLNKDILISEAINIGEAILSSAIYSKDRETITWLSVNINNNGEYDVSPLPGDFYDGLSGLIIFFYNLYMETKNIKYKEAYHRLLTSAQDSVQGLGNNSAIVGKLSMLYPLSVLTRNNEGNNYRESLYGLIRDCEENVDTLKHYDWIGGTTSLLNIIINIFEETKDMELLTLSIRLGRKLVDQLENHKEDLIGGFSHGASSISYVLIRLGKLCKTDDFVKKGIEILSFDRSLYSSDNKAWWDKTSDTPTCSSEWCHGSEGIGLSRILLNQYYHDDLIEQEIEDAIEFTLNNSFKQDDCLCHGNMGTTELLLASFKKDNNETHYRFAQEISLAIIDEAKKRGGYQTRSLPGFPAVGLYTGLAGIGNQLLRVANPHKVSSILSLN